MRAFAFIAFSLVAVALAAAPTSEESEFIEACGSKHLVSCRDSCSRSRQTQLSLLMTRLRKRKLISLLNRSQMSHSALRAKPSTFIGMSYRWIRLYQAAILRELRLYSPLHHLLFRSYTLLAETLKLPIRSQLWIRTMKGQISLSS
jgi:hypothetical protein